jgi:hypothetical protein
MTIQYLAGNKITGLSGDTKPTNVVATSKFLETDTNTEFIWDGSSWTQLGGSGKATY